MRTAEEARNTPVLLLTEEEIGLLSPAGQKYARQAREQRKREDACPGHEPVGEGTREQSMRGWHPAHCKHCGMDMSIDSGD